MIIIATLDKNIANVLHYDFGDAAEIVGDWLYHIKDYGDHFCLDDIERCPDKIDLQLIDIAIADDESAEFEQFAVEYVRERKLIDLTGYKIVQRFAITESTVEAWDDGELDDFIAGNLQEA